MFVHVSWDDWVNKLSTWDRACAVAHYRTHLSLEAHVQDAAEKAVKRREARGKRRAAKRNS